MKDHPLDRGGGEVDGNEDRTCRSEGRQVPGIHSPGRSEDLTALPPPSERMWIWWPPGRRRGGANQRSEEEEEQQDERQRVDQRPVQDRRPTRYFEARVPQSRGPLDRRRPLWF